MENNVSSFHDGKRVKGGDKLANFHKLPMGVLESDKLPG